MFKEIKRLLQVGAGQDSIKEIVSNNLRVLGLNGLNELDNQLSRLTNEEYREKREQLLNRVPGELKRGELGRFLDTRRSTLLMQEQT